MPIAIRPILASDITLEDRSKFARCFHIRSDGCWEWVAAKNEKGYGRLKVQDGRILRAHRVSYVIHFGEIPDGLVLDHLCRHPSCVNPSHLDPVTSGENVLRGESFSAVSRRRAKCKRGHDFTILKNGQRRCDVCQTAWFRTPWICNSCGVVTANASRYRHQCQRAITADSLPIDGEEQG